MFIKSKARCSLASLQKNLYLHNFQRRKKSFKQNSIQGRSQPQESESSSSIKQFGDNYRKEKLQIFISVPAPREIWETNSEL